MDTKAKYDAFISYRRGDATRLARWIRTRLQGYRLPPDVLTGLSLRHQEIHSRRPRVYLDTAYEKPNGNFLTDKIYPALDASDRLIVISSPKAFDTLPGMNGAEEPNWLTREIDRFIVGDNRATDRTQRPIEVVLGPGAPQNRFPGRLADQPHWDWVDLRRFTLLRSMGFSETLDAGLTKLVAALYDVPDSLLPSLRREERRRRNRFIMLIVSISMIVMAITGAFAAAWWSQRQAAIATDLERRLAVARGLLDIGSIPGAVDTLASLVEADAERTVPEAHRLYGNWIARLRPLGDALAEIPDDSVFRWAGTNFLKNRDGSWRQYSGPPALQSAVVGSGSRLVTLDADRRLRVRSVTSLNRPLLVSERQDVAPGTFHELFDGQLIRFDGPGLALHSDEDEVDAQAVMDDVTVFLDPSAGILAYAAPPVLQAECDQLIIRSDEGTLKWAVSGGEAILLESSEALHVKRLPDGHLQWTRGPADETVKTTGGGSAPCDGAGVAPAVAPYLSLRFPALHAETTFWERIGITSNAEDAAICGERAVDERVLDCVDVPNSISAADDEQLGRIFADHLGVTLVGAGTNARMFTTAVTGNQSGTIAICSLRANQVVRCYTTDLTARTRTFLINEGRFLVLNGPEVHERTFQLIDMQALSPVVLDQVPMEEVADVAMAADASLLAVLTQSGEVWIYARKRNGEFTISERLDVAPRESFLVKQSDDEGVFDSVAFAGARFIVMAGRRGGILGVHLDSRLPAWSRRRMPLAGTGSHRLISDVRTDTVAIFDNQSLQLISGSAGSLLTPVADFDMIVTAPSESAERSMLGVSIDEREGMVAEYGGQRFALRPRTAQVDPSDSTELERRTGISRSDGRPVLR